MGEPGGLPSMGKASVYNAGDLGLIPGSGSSLEKEKATHSRVDFDHVGIWAVNKD